jgi:group I intron endonuclease
MANINKVKKHHFIYKTTNLLNGKYYVGMHSTSDMKDGYLGSGTRLRHSIRKYGESNFKIEILEFLPTREELIKRERELVNEDLIKDSNCLNLKPGGSGGFVNKEHAKKFHSAGGKVSGKINGPVNGKLNGAKHRKKLEEDAEYRKKWLRSCDWTGRRHKPETIEKMRKTRVGCGKGQSNSQYGTRWINNGDVSKKSQIADTVPIGWNLGRIIKKL